MDETLCQMEQQTLGMDGNFVPGHRSGHLADNRRIVGRFQRSGHFDRIEITKGFLMVIHSLDAIEMHRNGSFDQMCPFLDKPFPVHSIHGDLSKRIIAQYHFNHNNYYQKKCREN